MSSSFSKHHEPRRPGRPATSRGPVAREQLLSAALELFAEQGVAATTFAMIAKRTGVTPAMLHYYFENRDALLDAVVDERLAQIVASVWGQVIDGTAPLDMICGIVERLLQAIEETRWLPSLWIREILSEGGLLRVRVMRHLPREKMHIVSKAIRKKQRQEELNLVVDPDLLVSSLVGLVMLHSATTCVWARAFDRKPPNRKALTRHITSLLLDGLRHVPRAVRALGVKNIRR